MRVAACACFVRLIKFPSSTEERGHRSTMEFAHSLVFLLHKIPCFFSGDFQRLVRLQTNGRQHKRCVATEWTLFNSVPVRPLCHPCISVRAVVRQSSPRPLRRTQTQLVCDTTPSFFHVLSLTVITSHHSTLIFSSTSSSPNKTESREPPSPSTALNYRSRACAFDAGSGVDCG